jgi:hypothetical protein
MRTERYKFDYNYRERFANLVTHAAFEGGRVLLAGTAPPCHVILDQGTFVDLLEEDDELITIHTFDDALERDAWLREHIPRPRTP